MTESSLSTKYTPVPWEVDDFDSGDELHSRAFRLVDSEGRTIVDTLNSEVACIEEEHDGDGPGVSRWDSRGEANIVHIAKAVNTYSSLSAENAQMRLEIERLRAALLLAIPCMVSAITDSQRFSFVIEDTKFALNQARAALAGDTVKEESHGDL